MMDTDIDALQKTLVEIGVEFERHKAWIGLRGAGHRQALSIGPLGDEIDDPKWCNFLFDDGGKFSGVEIEA